MNEIVENDVESVAMNLCDRDDFNMYKPKITMEATTGMADIHEIDDSLENAVLVHYDLNPKNVAIIGDGTVMSSMLQHS